MYNDDVSKKIDSLYDLHKDKPSIKKTMPWIKTFIEQRIPLEISDNTRFLFLFSFDFFYVMYPIVCCFINETTPNETQVNALIDTIKSKLKIKS